MHKCKKIHTHTKKKTYENYKKKLNGGMSSVASRFLFFTHFQTAIHIYIHKKYLHKATVLEICNNCLCNAFNKLIKKSICGFKMHFHYFNN